MPEKTDKTENPQEKQLKLFTSLLCQLNPTAMASVDWDLAKADAGIESIEAAKKRVSRARVEWKKLHPEHVAATEGAAPTTPKRKTTGGAKTSKKAKKEVTEEKAGLFLLRYRKELC
jgi:hypothetical protein